MYCRATFDLFTPISPHITSDFPVCNLVLEMRVVVSMRFGTGDGHQSRPLGLSNFDLDRTCLLLLRIARPNSDRY
jgi:hypothetical protein